MMLASLLLVYRGEPCEVLEEDLKKLETLGLVKGKDITAKGKELVEQILTKPLTLKGKVVSGDGEGRYYLSLKGYREQVKRKLGFDPFPGTLNVLLDPESSEKKALLALRRAIVLEGFTEGGRRYGEVLCYPARVMGLEGAVIIPLKTHHPPEIIEVISPHNLREKLKLKDGDPVEVTVY